MAEERGIGFAQKNTAMLPRGTQYFFGIGINQYPHWNPLRNAVNDVVQVAKLLQERYHFGEAQVKLLLDLQATRANIINQLHAYTRQNTLSEHDSLLIYFSGHGYLDDNGDGYWAPVEAQTDDIASLIPNSTVRDQINSMKCRHVLLVSDSCFSGSLIASRGGGQRGSDNLLAQELSQKKSRRILTSGGHDEPVSDGSKQNSPFAEAILSELGHNTKDLFLVDELFQHVRSITRANAPQIPQFEPLFGAGDLGGRFVFYLKNTVEPLPLPDVVDIPADTRSSTLPPVAPVVVKPSPEALAAKRKELMDLVAKGNSDQSLKRLIDFMTEYFPDDLDEAVALSGRLTGLKRKELQDVISFSDANIERNKINSTLLELIRRLA